MKKNLFFFVFFFSAISTFVHAQSEPSHTSTPIDSRLFEIYSGDYLSDLQTANPFLIQRWNFYLDHSWYLTELPAEKVLETYPTVQVEDLDKINIFSLERKFDLKRDWDRQLVCKIANTNKAIVLLSGKAFNEKLNDHLKAKN